MSTLTAFGAAARDTRRAWHLRASVGATAFAVAGLAPLVVGDSRLADLAGGLAAALAATGLAFAVGVGGLPSLAQGAFVAAGAVVSARLLQVSDGAIAIVDEGTGVDASWRIAARGSVPTLRTRSSANSSRTTPRGSTA